MAKEDSNNILKKFKLPIDKDKLKYFASYLGQFFLVVSIYGIIINLTSSQLFGFEFSLGRTFGFGAIAYFLKYELPIIIKSSIK